MLLYSLRYKVGLSYRRNGQTDRQTAFQLYIDPFPDLLHYRLFPCHSRHFGRQISITFNGVKAKGVYFMETRGANKLTLHC